MSKSNRLSYRLHPGEALVVGPIANFENIIELYESLSRMRDYSQEERDAWRECAEWVTEWLGKTAQRNGDGN